MKQRNNNKHDCSIIGVTPEVHYELNIDIDPGLGKMSGSGKIGFTNTTNRPISSLSFNNICGKNRKIGFKINEKPVQEIRKHEDSLISILLPQKIHRGEPVELITDFSAELPPLPLKGPCTITNWHPKIYQGFSTHDDYDVGITCPDNFQVSTSGVHCGSINRFRGNNIRSFGIIISSGCTILENSKTGHIIRIFDEGGKFDHLKFLLDTAVDSINFYKEFLGFYPYPILNIISGREGCIGGFPVATNIVALHKMQPEPLISGNYWQFIVAHEIGHQYFGEYVLEKDSPGWLWIALGMYCDREYLLSRDMDTEMHNQAVGFFEEGVKKGFNMSMDCFPQKNSKSDYNYNRSVLHGKSFAFIDSLSLLLGKENIKLICRRILREYAGKRMGALEFQIICEDITGKRLDGFFHEWIHSEGCPPGARFSLTNGFNKFRKKLIGI